MQVDADADKGAVAHVEIVKASSIEGQEEESALL